MFINTTICFYQGGDETSNLEIKGGIVIAENILKIIDKIPKHSEDLIFCFTFHDTQDVCLEHISFWDTQFACFKLISHFKILKMFV